ncbi:MAG: DNA cytosine methyltransferase [Clostridiales bacterium]|nr:DNA cytosine methyltransferase [Clostridiales bacterium]
MRSIEICAGAGGQALGLEQAGFEHAALVEIDPNACATLRANRPSWNVIEGDAKAFSAKGYKGIDLLAGGVPCPPFSVAGKQLGQVDDRDLFPEALRLAKECDPKAVMLENVKGLFSKKFDDYRAWIKKSFEELGYECFWERVNASDFGVPQKRERTVLVALKPCYAKVFAWPQGKAEPLTVGQALLDEMSRNGWRGAADWALKANRIAPTLVGGSKKHGGADLGPSRAKQAWGLLDVDGRGVADNPPPEGFLGKPKLTVQMAALIQGFPDDWMFAGKKTAAYRQVGNAFPPPVAKAIGGAILKALNLRSLQN